MGLNREQVDKLKRSWQRTMDFELLEVKGAEEYKDELESFKREVEHRLAEEKRAKLQLEHTMEVCYSNSTATGGESVKRIRRAGGWIYMRSIWMDKNVSSSMCFVPDLKAPEATPLPGGELF